MTPRRFVVGLTGGIGTGKSSALSAFESFGASTVSLDQIAHEQAKPGRAGYRAIIRDFGSCILNPNGTIDRALLGRVVFGDKKARLGLEAAIHPSILREMNRLIGRLKGVVIVDVPLLFEKSLQKNFDATILIACHTALQIKRVVRRDGLKPSEARRRIKAQMSLARKRELADVSIDNNATLTDLKKKVRQYHEGLRLLHGGISHGNNLSTYD